MSAIFHLRPPPPTDSAPGAAVKQPGSRPTRPRTAARRADGREKTLYDYWGISEKPKAFGPHGIAKISLRVRNVAGGGNGDGCATSEEEVASLVKEHYQHLVDSRALNDLDSRKVWFSKSSDRSIWILFSTRPYTMAIRKLWFQVHLIEFLSIVVDIYAAREVCFERKSSNVFLC